MNVSHFGTRLSSDLYRLDWRAILFSFFSYFLGFSHIRSLCVVLTGQFNSTAIPSDKREFRWLHFFSFVFLFRSDSVNLFNCSRLDLIWLGQFLHDLSFFFRHFLNFFASLRVFSELLRVLRIFVSGIFPTHLYRSLCLNCWSWKTWTIS